MIFCSCDKNSSESLDSVISKTLEVSDSALQQVGNLNSEDAKKEFKKLNQWEYQVLSFKKEILATELEGKLMVYGTQGYDCGTPLIRGEELIIVCKRRPESLLRYVPQGFIGKP